MPKIQFLQIKAIKNMVIYFTMYKKDIFTRLIDFHINLTKRQSIDYTIDNQLNNKLQCTIAQTSRFFD